MFLPPWLVGGEKLEAVKNSLREVKGDVQGRIQDLATGGGPIFNQGHMKRSYFLPCYFRQGLILTILQGRHPDLGLGGSSSNVLIHFVEDILRVFGPASGSGEAVCGWMCVSGGLNFPRLPSMASSAMHRTKNSPDTYPVQREKAPKSLSLSDSPCSHHALLPSPTRYCDSFLSLGQLN